MPSATPLASNAAASFTPAVQPTSGDRPESRHSAYGSSDARRSASSSLRRGSVSSRIRAASVKIMDNHPPVGAWAATADMAAKAPTLGDIRRGSFNREGWTDTTQQAAFERRMATSSPPAATDVPGAIERKRRLTTANAYLSDGQLLSIPPVTEEEPASLSEIHSQARVRNEPRQNVKDQKSLGRIPTAVSVPDHLIHYTDGYTPPPHLPWNRSTLIGLKAFLRFTFTFKGFLIVLYCLNVVGWGGMLFLLLIKAAPAMCRPTCEDDDSPRKKWLEIDSQILNALFCVTGLGLIPWRFRELYLLLSYRIRHRADCLRRLAGIHNNWFRLPGSDHLDLAGPDGNMPRVDVNNPSIPLPLSKTPEPPITGVRAPPTSIWKLDFVIWANVWNTFFQICLCGVMWGFNRFDRPGWTTGLFIALACGVAIAGGIMMFKEGKKVKRVEGVPPSDEDAKPDAEKP